MCKFLSAIGLKNGDILCNPSIDSHEDIISLYGLKDSKMRNWARIEFYPDDNDYFDVKKYSLKIDDDILNWITDELKVKWERKLVNKIKNIIINKNRFMIAGGVYILKDVEIRKAVNCKIFSMKNSTVNKMLDGGTVNKMLDGSTVNEMLDGSTVNKMLDGGTVNKMLDGSTVNKMFRGSTVNEMFRGSTVNEMLENSKIIKKNKVL